MLFFRFSVSASFKMRNCTGIEGDEGGGEKCGADDVGEPMHAGEKSADDGECRKENAENGDDCALYAIFDQSMACEGGAHENANGKHGMRGGVGCFERAVDKHGAVVDHEELKENVKTADENVEDGEEKDLAVDREQTLSR